MIADLSYHNPNVFYELAIRHAIRKPVIQIIESGQKIPFDVSGLRTIELVTESFDLGNIERAKEELRKHIVSIQKDPSRVESPVTTAIVFKNLAEGRPEQRLLLEIIQRLERAGLGQARTRRGYGNIHINTEVAPSPVVAIRPGQTLNLYFGDVTWSGGQVDLYLSTDGYATLTLPGDIKYGPTFSVAGLLSPIAQTIDRSLHDVCSIGAYANPNLGFRTHFIRTQTK